MRWSRSLFSD